MSDSEEPSCKRRRIEESHVNKSTEPDNEFDTSLLSLSDDVLLLILSLVDPASLVSLSKCCTRLHRICLDRHLWEYVDTRDDVYDDTELASIVEFLNVNTKLLAIRGPYVPQLEYLPAVDDEAETRSTLCGCFLASLRRKAPKLETLIIENHIIDARKVTLEDFPPFLHHLKIICCDVRHVSSERSFFYDMNVILKHIKTLDLSRNTWFVPHSLLALSKCKSLESLNLSGCDVSDCLPYTSLASTYGFQGLKTLDLRCSGVSDIELTCFNRTISLRHLYLCPSDRFDHRDQVTDFSITAFGSPNDSDGEESNRQREFLGIIVIEIGRVRRPRSNLETLVMNNYPGITDISLEHCAKNLKSLKHLDVSGCAVTANGIRRFQSKRPDVEIIYTGCDDKS